ncbi:MAG: hypothetical protein JJU11_15090 [Candidatus Sumerlaeia bacterium]|nr:hypothetical protein [Candidatus Sumerlaeia bacterium]
MRYIHRLIYERGFIGSMGEQEEAYLKATGFCLLTMLLGIPLVLIDNSLIFLTRKILGLSAFCVAFVWLTNTHNVLAFCLSEGKDATLNRNLDNIRLVVDLLCIMSICTGYVLYIIFITVNDLGFLDYLVHHMWGLKASVIATALGFGNIGPTVFFWQQKYHDDSRKKRGKPPSKWTQVFIPVTKRNVEVRMKRSLISIKGEQAENTEKPVR